MRQVFQTPGVPPRMGRTILPIMGCTEKRSNAATNIVNPNSQAKAEILREGKPATVSVAFFVEEGMKGTYRQSDMRKKSKGPGAFTGIVLVPNVVERTPPYVEEVLPGSPAAAAGLKADDLIVYIDGELVSTISLYHELLGSRRPGETIQLEVQRGNKLEGKKLILAKFPEAKAPPK